MKINTKYLTFLFIFAVSCNSFSKEDYLGQYADFMDNISENYDSFDQEQWKDADKQQDKFINEWYDMFKDEFTRRERVTIAGYKVRYNTMKSTHKVRGFYDQFLKDDFQELQAQIESYIENEMNEDLNLFLEEARNTSKELYEEALRIIDELQIENRELTQ